MHKTIQNFAFAIVVGCILLFAGCAKKVAKVQTPPTPPPAQPRATLAANPSVIAQGQSTELTWKTNNADHITIAGLGDLPPSGSRTITPSESTTYTLTANGPGGSQQADTRVTVNPAAAKASTPSLSEEELFGKKVKDVFFDYNKSNLRTDQTSISQNDASFLAQHPDIKVVIEGHCDDRGSEEYNLALGDTRASSLKSSLVAQGVSADRIKIVSYGKEHPFCRDENEACWQQNRRDHLGIAQ